VSTSSRDPDTNLLLHTCLYCHVSVMTGCWMYAQQRRERLSPPVKPMTRKRLHSKNMGKHMASETGEESARPGVPTAANALTAEQETRRPLFLKRQKRYEGIPAQRTYILRTCPIIKISTLSPYTLYLLPRYLLSNTRPTYLYLAHMFVAAGAE